LVGRSSSGRRQAADAPACAHYEFGGLAPAFDVESLRSSSFVKRDNDIGVHALMRRETRFACINPTGKLHDSSCDSAIRIRLSRLDDVKSVPVEEECVIAKIAPELLRDWMLAGNYFSAELSQGPVDASRR
jgi:hypothetical protein